MEFEIGYDRLTIQENKTIFNRLFVDFFPPDDPDIVEDLLDHDLPTLSRVYTDIPQHKELFVEFMKEPSSRTDGLPANFLLPAIGLTKEFGHNTFYSTSYGFLPSRVIDKSNTLFFVSNRYFFNQEGQALKKEELIQDESTYEITEELKENVLQLDFSLGESSSRFVGILPGEYEYLWAKIIQFETGEFSEVEL